ncbi:hypothetical protein M885DRAFT_529130 [Pelagophyceae sp. CCMP2097]|nr:hypothetical protein M885DRAFT_529130 [Pelagophyceae sp. CCMP2097]
MRHAEKRRSCVHSDFAERVAEAALAAYRALPPSAAEERGAQPVVAAFVLEPPDGGELTVVSLGAGTRFSCTGKADEPRDGHAEVVARRGLKRFLGRVLRGDAGVQQWPDLIDGRGEFVGGLHLYVSSCPCGNAVSEPPRYNAAGVRIDAVADANGRDAGQAYAQHAPLSFASVPADVSAAPKFDKIGAPLSCSDKIATWSCVGVQGARLLGPGLLEGPVYLRSVVVGRKFNARRLRRAACCRVRNFETPPFKCHHPAVLGEH